MASDMIMISTCGHSKTAWAANKEYCVFCGRMTGFKQGPDFTKVAAMGDYLPVKATLPQECCGTNIKIWGSDSWVCEKCFKPAYNSRAFYPGEVKQVCECGATKVGLGHHSTWCPLHVIP